jgi:hypothetical protein
VAITTRESEAAATIAARVRALPPEKQREVLDFIEAVTRNSGTGDPLAHAAQRDEDTVLINRCIDTVNVDHDHPSYARLAGYGIPVWAVIGTWKASGDLHAVAREWDIAVEYVQAALAYYRRYGKYIDALLLLNQEPPYEPDTDRR